MPVFAGLGRIGGHALNLVLPPRCLACGRIGGETGGLCADCWKSVSFIEPPFCARCAFPFDFEAGDKFVCPNCARDDSAWDRARAVFRYDDGSRRLILAFKRSDRTDAAPVFAQWLARAGGALVAEADVIAPVPLHWRRLFGRRYNQSALLAAQLGKLTGRPVELGLLKRLRHTPSMGRGHGPDWRRRNVRGAFAVASGTAAKIAKKRVLLIDDVLTTGATLSACAAALKKAGAAGVDVLTLARTVTARA